MGGVLARRLDAPAIFEFSRAAACSCEVAPSPISGLSGGLRHYRQRPLQFLRSSSQDEGEFMDRADAT